MYLTEMARCFAEVNAAMRHTLRLLARSGESLARTHLRLRESSQAIRRSRALLAAARRRVKDRK